MLIECKVELDSLLEDLATQNVVHRSPESLLSVTLLQKCQTSGLTPDQLSQNL